VISRGHACHVRYMFEAQDIRIIFFEYKTARFESNFCIVSTIEI
jgi:hypothetical protein